MTEEEKDKRKEYLSKRLKYFRKQSGYTQAEVAKVLSIDRSTYSSYESRKLRMDVISLDKVCEMFGVEIGFFLHSEIPDIKK